MPACTHKRDNPGSDAVILEEYLIQIGLIITYTRPTHVKSDLDLQLQGMLI